MTVGVYAENKPSVEVLEIRKALDQVISLYTHVVQVTCLLRTRRKEGYLLRYYL